MRRQNSLKIILRQHHHLLLLLLFLLPLLVRGAATEVVGQGQQMGEEKETVWLTFSTHDLELVAKEHENATVYLLARGTFSECFTVNFTYDPGNPSIAPLNDFFICPSYPTLSPSTSTPSATSHPTSPSTFLTPKNCRGCEAGHDGVSREDASATTLLPRPSFLNLQGWAFRRSGKDSVSSEEEVVANVSVEVVSRWVGKTVLGVTTNSTYVGVTDAFVRVSVIHTRVLDVAADVIGWGYTILWDVSFLPQVWLNWRRKSVEGFSLDNVALNFIAYLYYALFNVAFFCVPFIKDQFRARYPRSVNHVQINDVFFASYALFIIIVLAVQCIMYGRKAGLRVSRPCMALVTASIVVVGVYCVLAAVGVVWWLDVFYVMSYMKLVITPLKYIPQAYINYKLKSTKGFSVFGVTMDFAGGVLSLVQMFLLSANSDDFVSIFTNFSKFGLGIITLVFDIIFFSQHWCYHLSTRRGIEGHHAE